MSKKSKIQLLATVLVLFLCITVSAQNMTVYLTESSLQTAVAKLEEVIDRNDLIRFETVVHETIAKNIGVSIDSTEVIFFEDPTLTSKLILCEQTTALDLPLKIMVWKEEGETYIGYIDPKQMQRRFLINECGDTLERMSKLMIRIVNDAMRQL